MDFPSDRYHKNVISSWSIESVGLGLGTTNLSSGSGAFPSANMAIYVPFAIAGPYLARKVWWANGLAVSGNVDVGVYSSDGTRLLSAGSTAQATIQSIQSVDTTDVLLLPGSYYLAMSCSTTAATFYRLAANVYSGVSWGMANQAAALPLPATATFATAAATTVPLFGITSGTIL